jgi:uncharacterized protein Yka (UPF0111/DUF47 family)
MFSLQKFICKDEEFYALLEASAEEGWNSAKALRKMLAEGVKPAMVKELEALRDKDRSITENIVTKLGRSYLATIGREEIEELASALYRIPKSIDKFAERYLDLVDELAGVDFRRQSQLLEEATENVAKMMKGIRDTTNLIKLVEYTQNLQRIENEADELVGQLQQELYSGKYEPIKALVLKDLFELLERVVDRCRDAANVISQIILKYS